MLINICIIKQITTSYPSIFEDSANCVSHTLEKVGIKNIISYNTIDPGIPNIVFGVGAGNTVSIAKFKEIAKPNKTIIFNMEQTGSNSSFVNNEYLQLLSEYTTLDYNQANIEATTRTTQKKAPGFEFPLAPYQDLKTNPQHNQNYKIHFDLAFYGAPNPERIEKIEQLQSMGLRIKIINRAFGEFLTDTILDCKAVLNLHYYDTCIFEAARALRPTAIGIPVISEPSILPKTVDWQESGVFFAEGNFYTNTAELFKDHDRLTELSRKSILFTKEEKWLSKADEVIKKSLIELRSF